jgi:hypothetical protein
MYSLISNPTSDRNTSPAHPANQTTSQTFPSGSVVDTPVWVIHGNGFRSGEGVLSPATHAAGLKSSAGHHGGCSRILEAEIICSLVIVVGGGGGTLR